MIKSDPQFELASEPESNIICFNFVPEEHNDIAFNQINSVIRERIVMEDSFYIVQVKPGEKTWIWLTIINPVTSGNDLWEHLRRIKETGIREA